MGDHPWNRLEGWYDQPRHMKMIGVAPPERAVIPISEAARAAPAVSNKPRRRRKA